MFPPMDSFFSLFIVIFVLAFIVIVISIGLSLWRMFRSRNYADETSSEGQPAVQEKVVVREVVKVRCSYCGNLYDETLDKCPYCGARKL